MTKEFNAIKTKAACLANFIRIKNNVDAEGSKRDLLEIILDLNNGNDIESTFENWNNYFELIQEVGFILTDPKISCRLSEFLQTGAYKMFKSLAVFFELLSESEDIQNFLLAYSIENYFGNMTMEQLESLENYHS